MTQILSRPVSSGDIAAGLKALGLKSASAEVHASLRSFGKIENGAGTVVEALLSVLDSVLVPTFCWEASSPPPPADEGLKQNATGADFMMGLPPKPRPFDPVSSPVDCGMGALPRAVLARPGSRRTAHPLNSWTALGPRAAYLAASYHPEDPYRPLKRLEEGGGHVLLLGVGLHAYGFMDAGFKWLTVFYASQLLIIGLGLLPLNLWSSFRANGPASSPGDHSPTPAAS